MRRYNFSFYVATKKNVLKSLGHLGYYGNSFMINIINELKRIIKIKQVLVHILNIFIVNIYYIIRNKEL